MTTPPIEEYVALIVEALQYHDIIARTFLQSFDWRLAIQTKALLPELKVGMLTDQQSDGTPQSPISGNADLWTNNLDLGDFNSVPDMVKYVGGNVWSCNALDVSKTDVITAHQLGLEVYVWTVNSQTQMKEMVDLGVDAITTDYPDRLHEVLKHLDSA